MLDLVVGTAYKVEICGVPVTLVYQGTAYDDKTERIKLRFQANSVISWVESNKISKIEA